MAKIILTCGKICSGKTTYAKRLARELPAVHFSVDDLTMLLLGPYAGDVLEEYVEKLEGYFFEKAVELAKSGISSVIDIGLWTEEERKDARRFFSERGVGCEIHYIKIPDDVWRGRIAKRNKDIEAGKSRDYYVDENLMKKFQSCFEEPSRESVDRVISEDG